MAGWSTWRDYFAASMLPACGGTLSAAIITILMATIVVSSAGCGNADGSSQAGTAAAGSESSRYKTGGNTKSGPGDRSGTDSPVRLVFIHHSVGEDWLDDSKGGLARALKGNNFFVSDTNYGWGPADMDVGDERIGDHTDIGHWYNWFVGDNSGIYLEALYREDGINTSSPYSRLREEPAGENQIIVFKSCFTNSPLGGDPDAAPASGRNPLRGEPAGEDVHTVQNANGTYNEIGRAHV